MFDELNWAHTVSNNYHFLQIVENIKSSKNKLTYYSNLKVDL